MSEIRTVPDFLSREECGDLVRLWHDTPALPQRFPNGTALSGQQQAASDWDARIRYPSMRWLSKRLSATALATVPGIDGAVDNLVLTIWRVGMSMALHSDYGAWGEFPRRDYAAVVFLNDDFDGGEHYLEDGTEIAPVTGTLLVHPGGTLRHGVKTVARGPRYTAACWFGRS